MDIASGLAAASTAIGIVKELREIDRSVDEASFKLKIAELVETLADTKIALSEAKEALALKDVENRELRRQLEAKNSGTACPICKSGRLETKAVREHPVFGPMGHQEHDMECSNQVCRHRERRKVDPRNP